jgi:hypothetical protein
MIPWLSVVAPHGLTDICTRPVGHVICTHAAALCMLDATPEPLRLAWLIPFSLVHLRRDAAFAGADSNTAMAYSFALHAIWAACPSAAAPYLAYVHTPLHYFSVIKKHRIRSLVPALVATSALLILPYSPALNAFASLWVAPVVAHVLLQELH